MNRLLPCSAAAICLIVLALAVPATAAGALTTTQPIAAEPCTGPGCQPAQVRLVPGLTGVPGPQRENQRSANYVLGGLLALLLVIVPVVVARQRNLSNAAAPTRNATVAPTPRNHSTRI